MYGIYIRKTDVCRNGLKKMARIRYRVFSSFAILKYWRSCIRGVFWLVVKTSSKRRLKSKNVAPFCSSELTGQYVEHINSYSSDSVGAVERMLFLFVRVSLTMWFLHKHPSLCKFRSTPLGSSLLAAAPAPATSAFLTAETLVEAVEAGRPCLSDLANFVWGGCGEPEGSLSMNCKSWFARHCRSPQFSCLPSTRRRRRMAGKLNSPEDSTTSASVNSPFVSGQR